MPAYSCKKGGMDYIIIVATPAINFTIGQQWIQAQETSVIFIEIGLLRVAMVVLPSFLIDNRTIINLYESFLLI